MLLFVGAVVLVSCVLASYMMDTWKVCMHQADIAKRHCQTQRQFEASTARRQHNSNCDKRQTGKRFQDFKISRFQYTCPCANNHLLCTAPTQHSDARCRIRPQVATLQHSKVGIQQNQTLQFDTSLQVLLDANRRCVSAQSKLKQRVHRVTYQVQEEGPSGPAAP